MCMWEWIGAGWQKGSCQGLQMAEKMHKGDVQWLGDRAVALGFCDSEVLLLL